MPSFVQHVREWLGYTRQERRASSILIVILFTIIAIRYLAPEPTISIEKIPVNISEALADTDLPRKINTKPIKYNAKGVRFVSGQSGSRSLLELNSCDSVALKVLPGIGSVLSVRIIKYRNLLGGFVSVSQLREVYGLKEEAFSLIEPRVKVDSSAIRKIKINKAAYKELRHPYLTQKEVSDILKYRELKGRITGLTDIRENNLISPENLKKIRPYLDFGK